MGEYAEMMLDGTMCCVCGEFMGSGGEGFPRTCAGCSRSAPAPTTRVKCPQCGKKVKEAGLADHKRDVHGIRPV